MLPSRGPGLLLASLLLLAHSFAMQLRGADLSPQQLRDFKRNFLLKLGLPERPRPKRAVEVPDYLWNIYDEISGLPDRSEPSDTVRHYSAHDFTVTELGALAHFDLRNFPSKEELLDAQLRLPVLSDEPLRLNVLEIVRTDVTRLMDTRKLSRSQDGWIVMDVFPAAMRRRRRMMRLLLELRHPNGTLVRDIGHFLGVPSLQLYGLDLTDSRRARRAARKGRGGKKRRKHRHRAPKSRYAPVQRERVVPERGLCQRRNIYVDFRELNWQDWILAPEGFESYYCSGMCVYPLVDAQNTTNHAIVQSLVNSVSPGAAPEPCCVPTEMSTISMLYIDIDNRIVIKNYPDMIVEGCGCR